MNSGARSAFACGFVSGFGASGIGGGAGAGSAGFGFANGSGFASAGFLLPQPNSTPDVSDSATRMDLLAFPMTPASYHHVSVAPPMTTDLPTLAINTIRTLSIDGVQKANSGHPGLPLGCAPMAYVLWQN